MDHSQLSTLKRNKLQHLAKREGLKANLKNVEIIRLLLEKYPGGVPGLTEKLSASKRPSSSKAKRPARGNRKPTTKLGAVSVKTEETHPNMHAEPPLDEPEENLRGRVVRSMAPPPVTPTAALYRLRTPVDWQLPTTPPIDLVAKDGHDAVHPPEATPTPPEAAAATSHQVRGMLRNLRDVIDATSLESEDSSSILQRAKALNAVLDTAILPRLMKVDKEVKDLVCHRVSIEEALGPRFKQPVVLPRASDVRSRPPSPKRPREEGGGEANPPPPDPRPSKRTRAQ